MIYGILILCVLEKRVLKYGSSIKSLVNWKKKHRKEPVWDNTWYNSPRGDAVGFPRIGPTDYIGGNKGHNSWPPYCYNWQQGVFIVLNIIICYETIITMPSANMVGFGFQTKSSVDQGWLIARSLTLVTWKCVEEVKSGGNLVAWDEERVGDE